MLNPYLLLFLPLALAPVLLHLMTLQRLKTVEISTFRFLMDSYAQQRRKLRWLEWLLMALRTGFVALVVMTLARPVIEKMPWLTPASAGRDVAIVLDTGLTMSARTAGVSSLDRAKAAAKAIVERLGPADRVKIIRAGDKATVLVDRFAHDRKAMLDAIDRLTTCTTVAHLPAALDEATAESRGGKRIIYVISDLGRRAWSSLENRPAQAADAQWVLMDVSPTQPVGNLAIVGDAPASSQAVVGLPVVLSATVVSGWRDKSVDAVVSLIVDDQQAGQFNISLQPGQRQTRTMSFTPTHDGPLRCRFELPADAFPDDDAYLFSLNVQPHLEVLVVSADAATKANDDGLYVRAALESPLSARGRLDVAQQQLASALKIVPITPDQLTPAFLDEAHAVILADVPMDEAKGRLLRDYLTNGGGVLAMPGRRVGAQHYVSDLLRPRGKDAKAAIDMTNPVGDPDDEHAFTTLTALDLTHPVLRCFDDPRQRYFAAARIYRHFPLKLPESDDASRVLMRYADRAPAMVELRVGAGKLLLTSFPASPAWSNVPLKPEFVPLLLRSVEYLRRMPRAAVASVVPPGEPAVVTLTSRWSHAQVDAVTPAGQTLPLTLHRDGDHFVAAVLQTDEKGPYIVTIHPRASDAPEEVKLGFAVNLDTQDATLASIDRAKAAELLGQPDLAYLRGEADDPMLTRQLARKREIWRTLIWLMFAVIGLEFLLATLGPSRIPGESSSPGLGKDRRRWWAWMAG
ncbi:MAG: VWA domain-containing protein [Phycisphaeraceae bacterium]|nr:VWA domain-containing protein [Phycisphaeraceae bacterium]